MCDVTRLFVSLFIACFSNEISLHLCTLQFALDCSGFLAIFSTYLPSMVKFIHMPDVSDE